MVHRARRDPARARRRRLSGHRRSRRCGRQRPGAPARRGIRDRRNGRAGLRPDADLRGEVLRAMPAVTTRMARRRTSTWGRTTWQTRLVGVNPKGGGANPSLCGAGGPYLVAGVQPATGLFLDKVKPDTTAGLRRVDAADRAEAVRGGIRLRPELGECARHGRPRRDRPDRRSWRERRRQRWDLRRRWQCGWRERRSRRWWAWRWRRKRGRRRGGRRPGRRRRPGCRGPGWQRRFGGPWRRGR